MQKIKRDDEVIVIAGKDKGKRGTVKRVLENRFLVSGVNMIKRHTKPNPMAGNQGGIVEREAPIHASNVAIFNSETGKLCQRYAGTPDHESDSEHGYRRSSQR